MRPIGLRFMECLTCVVPPIFLTVLVAWWIIKKAWVPKTLQEQNLNIATTAPNKRITKLEVTSLLISVMGLMLPCLLLSWYFFAPADSVTKIVPRTPSDASLPFFYTIFFISFCIGASAVILGIRALREKDRENIPRSLTNLASAGIILGFLTIPCVLLPLLTLIILAKVCVRGC
jgi:hypothetical protein